MYLRQTTLFDDIQYNCVKPDNVINVASVPQLSPFRYPGSKTWLVPYVRRWLSSSIRQQNTLSPISPTEFIEPFAGGGIISLTVATENLANHIEMVEIDEDVAVVWQTIFHEEFWQWLARAIVSFDLTEENIKGFFVRADLTLQERALKTIVRNRVNRGVYWLTGQGVSKMVKLARVFDHAGIPLLLRNEYRISHH